MKALRFIAFALAVLASGAVLARASVPVVNLLDQPVTTASGKALTVEEVQKAIRSAAEARKWVVVTQPDGRLAASYSWNGNKHTIVINIACQPDRYSLTYKNSVNMNYATDLEGKPMIHPYYNRFVGELRDAIRVEFMKL